MRAFITYCSAKKDDSLKGTGIEVTPDDLYIGKTRIQPFMRACRQQRVRWAIFSDLYGIWFSDEKHSWYEKSPNDVTETEYRALLNNFDNKLGQFNEIYFYRPNPRRFHTLYERILRETSLIDRVQIIPSIHLIK